MLACGVCHRGEHPAKAKAPKPMPMPRKNRRRSIAGERVRNGEPSRISIMHVPDSSPTSADVKDDQPGLEVLSKTICHDEKIKRLCRSGCCKFRRGNLSTSDGAQNTFRGVDTMFDDCPSGAAAATTQSKPVESPPVHIISICFTGSFIPPPARRPHSGP